MMKIQQMHYLRRCLKICKQQLIINSIRLISKIYIIPNQRKLNLKFNSLMKILKESRKLIKLFRERYLKLNKNSLNNRK